MARLIKKEKTQEELNKLNELERIKKEIIDKAKTGNIDDVEIDNNLFDIKRDRSLFKEKKIGAKIQKPDNELTRDDKNFIALYDKLFDCINVVMDTPTEQWTPKHAVAYVAKKYQLKYEKPFRFTFTKIPSNSSESFQCYRVCAMLGVKAGQYAIFKEYIDWFFDSLIDEKRIKFTSFWILTKQAHIENFFDVRNNKKKCTMNTKLPDTYINFLSKHPKLEYIKTYGDLKFYTEALKERPSKYPQDIKDMIDQMYDLMDLRGILKRVE